MSIEDDDKEPQTRKSYREHQRQSDDEFDQRDQKRIKAEREYSRMHRGEKVDQPDQDIPDDVSEFRSKKIVTGDQKVHQLKRKLNLVIIGLVLAIIIVYLVLFFVG